MLNRLFEKDIAPAIAVAKGQNATFHRFSDDFRSATISRRRHDRIRGGDVRHGNDAAGGRWPYPDQSEGQAKSEILHRAHTKM
jgi:hypothetical protein